MITAPAPRPRALSQVLQGMRAVITHGPILGPRAEEFKLPGSAVNPSSAARGEKAGRTPRAEPGRLAFFGRRRGPLLRGEPHVDFAGIEAETVRGEPVTAGQFAVPMPAEHRLNRHVEERGDVASAKERSGHRATLGTCQSPTGLAGDT